MPNRYKAITYVITLINAHIMLAWIPPTWGVLPWC